MRRQRNSGPRRDRPPVVASSVALFSLFLGRLNPGSPVPPPDFYCFATGTAATLCPIALITTSWNGDCDSGQKENKSDVKAIMARFEASEMSTNDAASTPPGRPKNALHPTLSFNPTVPPKKPVTESLSGSPVNIPPKPSFLKNTAKSNAEAIEPNLSKTPESRFAKAQDDTRTPDKPFITSRQHLPLSPALGQKPPLNKPSLGSTVSDSKPPFPKPCLAGKPSWLKEVNGGGAPGTTPPKIPPLHNKPSSSIFKLHDEMTGNGTNSANKNLHPLSSTFKPTSSFKVTQNMFNKEDHTGEPEKGVAANRVKNPPLTATNSQPPPVPPASKKNSLRKPPKSPLQDGGADEATSGPRRKPLPNILALGPAPAKPNRPAKVNLERFKRGAESSDDVPGIFKKPFFPTPPASHPGNHSNHKPPTPPAPALPSLPPRHPGTMIQQDDFYDDVDAFSSPPPPLPPSTGHPSQRAKKEDDGGDDDDDDVIDNDEDDDDYGEMYEDLDERWEAAEQKQEKKDDREEKKRLEAEKREQKQREKKEHDARKKFKLAGPQEAIHQVAARVDSRASKTDLGLKQGECLDIIRVLGNPEGKWLARTRDGSIGYVKITSVEIDFNTLKNCKPQKEYDPEVYDDIDVASTDNSGIKGPGVVPPPPPGEGGEIYDDVVDPNLEVSPLDARSSPTKPRSLLRMFDRSRRAANTKVVPPPRQFTADTTSDQPGAAINEDIYDDVDSQNLPPLPPLSSLLTLKAKCKTEELDPKKQKKIEKEEKEFRKKFKYEGEIQTLYQVTSVPTLTQKKWTGKELQIKAGERLDVIVKAVDNKLVCRNEEGKFGYVSTSHVVLDDGEIYDDIGEDNIYDND
ncbi:FYN-binding protein 1 [Brachionichthys hirsutus]|uniref:FYN-binding protein 1 n=1 Tax=Brachionichthys hirsutus TaxID=412623 RepID=UPI003604A2C0